MNLHLFSSVMILSAMLLTTGAECTTFPTSDRPMSKHGLIQNVQNYSSNPFWTPDSPYNQRMPQPVYVQGVDVGTSDCQRVVSALVASYCASRNNCINDSLDDARPTLIIQLASIPSHNYATACAGFIDTEFQSYVATHSTAAPTNKQVAFPGATAPNPVANESEFKIQNPYAPQLPTWNGDPWMQEMLERKIELENLQSQNGAGNEKIVRADFPTTAADLSFSERMENAATGYAPYKDTSAYEQLNIESEETYLQRQQELKQMQLLGQNRTNNNIKVSFTKLIDK